TQRAEIEGYSRLTPFTEIESAANNFNLNLARYIDPGEPEDMQDIDAHLNGGIPERDVDALANYWEALPELRQMLFEDGDRSGYVQLKAPIPDVEATITSHPAFVDFNVAARARFESWRKRQAPRLRGIEVGGHPKELIAPLSEE